MTKRTHWLVIREVATDRLRLSRTMTDYKPKADKDYTFGGPFISMAAARQAVITKSLALWQQLYGDEYDDPFRPVRRRS